MHCDAVQKAEVTQVLEGIRRQICSMLSGNILSGQDSEGHGELRTCFASWGNVDAACSASQELGIPPATLRDPKWHEESGVDAA